MMQPYGGLNERHQLLRGHGVLCPRRHSGPHQHGYQPRTTHYQHPYFFFFAGACCDTTAAGFGFNVLFTASSTSGAMIR